MTRSQLLLPLLALAGCCTMAACMKYGDHAWSECAGRGLAFAPSGLSKIQISRGAERAACSLQSSTFTASTRISHVVSGSKKESDSLRRSPVFSLRMGLNEDLWKAAEYGFENEVADLAEKGADIHAADESQMGKTLTLLRDGQALHLAAGQGHALAVAKLLELGADPDVQTEIGSGPLHLAAAYGHYTTITYLLQYGANPSMENIDGDTPLKIAKFKGRYSDRVDFVHVVEKLEEAAAKTRR